MDKQTNDKYLVAKKLSSSNIKNNIIAANKFLIANKSFRDSQQLYDDNIIRLKQIENQAKLQKAKIKRGFIIGTPIAVLLMTLLMLTIFLFVPSARYSQAMNHLNSGNYTQAIAILEDIDGFSDARNQVEVVKSKEAFERGDYEAGIDYIYNIGGTVNVTYDSNGGNASLLNQTIKAMQYIDNEANRTGYDFYGWVQEDYELNNKKNNYRVDLSLKASWEPITYTITYQLNGGRFNEVEPTSYS
jgi:uncharacterized repeat protein (TIGR02543 family)